MEEFATWDGWEEHPKGFLVVVSGPGGVGKNTLIETVFPAVPGLIYSVSATTRPPRPGEQDGVDYYFLSDEQFTQMVANEELLEWAEFCGWKYGTPRRFVEEQIEQGKTVIMDLDIQGAAQVRHLLRGAVFVFVMPPNAQELQQRLESRKRDSAEVIQARMEKAVEEMQSVVDYDYYIVNDELQKAAERLAAVILAERSRVSRMEVGFLQQLWQRRT